MEGIRVPNDLPLDLLVAASTVRAVEMYRTRITTPAQFAGLTDCGTIVFWLGERE